MRGEKLSYTEYLTSQKMGDSSRVANIIDLRKRNKEGEKKDKLNKIYNLCIGFVGLIFFIGIFIYL